jgi:hypothetical protein
MVVVNTPPRFVSTPPATLSGGVFRYPAVAEDPDGDAQLEFRLEEAPEGMAIDRFSGLITWTPRPEQTGLHTVSVVAEDLHEGTGRQEFEVRVSSPAEASSPAEVSP